MKLAMNKRTKSKKNKSVPGDRNSREAEVAEREKPYDEVGKTNEEIRRENQEPLSTYPEGETKPAGGPVPTDGS
jgi:hypothetical protein